MFSGTSKNKITVFTSGFLNDARITLPPLQFVNLKHLQTEKKRDTKIEQALVHAYQLHQQRNVRYYYNFVDLNGDGVPEIFVYLKGERFCNDQGCSAIILKQTPQGYRVLSKFKNVFQPIVVSKEITNGYHDLIFFVPMGGADPFYAIMKFKDNSYPPDPEKAPRVSENAKVEGSLLIADALRPNAGIDLH